MTGSSYYYRVATHLNNNPDDLVPFFEKQDSLEVFANILGMLKKDVREMAAQIAGRIIIKIAKQIADTGTRSGKLKLVRGWVDGAELELDLSLEQYTEAPELGIVENLVSYIRKREKEAFIMFLDHSYSMKGLKIVLAAITAASIAQHFKRDYAIMAFSNSVTMLKAIDESTGPEEILQRLFALELYGDTDFQRALEAGLYHLRNFDRKRGLILTDGAWNQGGDPLDAAARFDKLSAIGFPPSKHEKIRILALKGKGECAFVENQHEISRAIIRCLN